MLMLMSSALLVTENSTRRISELVLLPMFLFLLMFISRLFSVVLTLMLELVLML